MYVCMQAPSRVVFLKSMLIYKTPFSGEGGEGCHALRGVRVLVLEETSSDVRMQLLQARLLSAKRKRLTKIK